ncbi:MAG: hypothetical protein EOO80_19725 [Oxalobacteraceae bacterium]|nr:MAG: hypothetical protein EOO80_19725 [Oxalobacteraceae bacterium]
MAYRPGFALAALQFALIAAPAIAQEAPLACAAERAVYTMVDENGEFRAAFIPALHHASVVSDFYFKLTTPQRAYWFTFSASNGYGGITLIPVSDPYAPKAQENGPTELLREASDTFEEDAQRELLATLRFIPLDHDLKELPNPPSSGDTAPPYLLLPEIGVTLWYGASSLTEDQSAQRDSISRSAFKLVGCAQEAPPRAWP